MKTRLLFPFACVLLLACRLTPDPALVSGYALIYGISRYNIALPEGFGPNLQYPDNDVIDMESLLTSKGYEVVARIDSEATRAQIEADFAAASSVFASDPDRLFFFYYAGHGTTSDNVPSLRVLASGESGGDEWIFPYGSITGSVYSTVVTPSAALRDDELAALLATIPSTRRLVILDSCYSGGFLGSSWTTDGVPQNYDEEAQPAFRLALDSIDSYFGTPEAGDITPSLGWVLSAAGEDEVSWDGSAYNNGVFSYYFMEAAVNGDADGDGWITLDESCVYTRNAIDQYWNAHFTPDPANPKSGLFLPHVSTGTMDLLLYPVVSVN